MRESTRQKVEEGEMERRLAEKVGAADRGTTGWEAQVLGSWRRAGSERRLAEKVSCDRLVVRGVAAID